MNTTFSEFSVARPCVVPFTVTDFVYNPRCHSEAFLKHLSQLFIIYMDCMALFYSTAFALVSEHWVNILSGIIVGSLVVGIIKVMFFEDPDEPLTNIEADIVHYIHANASTGSTTRMLYEYLNSEGTPVDMDTLNKTLKNLQRRQMLLPVQATLWVAAGK